MLLLFLEALCFFFLFVGGARPPHNYVVHALVTLGDSFSANPGAGMKILNSACSIFDECFPFQIFKNGQYLLPNHGFASFDPLMCSGAKIKDVQDKQIPKIPTNANFVTLTMGGNDLGFSWIVDACIYNFIYSDCSSALDSARKTIDSTEFVNGFAAVIAAIYNRAPNTNLYVLGYPEFFNADTSQCNTTCFKPNPGRFFTGCGDTLLTYKRRTELNSLTLKLNHKIQSIVQLESNDGKSIVYLETSTKFAGHRFCEEGVDEPEYNNASIWFYPFTYYKRDWIAQLNKKRCGDDGALKIEPLGNVIACGISEDNSTYVKALEDDKAFESTTWPDPGTDSGSINAPDFITRIFHPVIAGATVYKEVVLAEYHGN